MHGLLTAEQVRLIALVAIPNLDDLIDDRAEGWVAGGRGLTQLVLLHAISIKLRTIVPWGQG